MAFLDKLGSLAKNLGDKTNEAIAMSKLKNYIGKGSCGNRAEKNR